MEVSGNRPEGVVFCLKSIRKTDMMDLKVMNSVLGELEDEKGIPRAKVVEAIEMALATAYKKEYAKKGQVIRAHLDLNSGATEFQQVKTIVDESTVRFADNAEEEVKKPARPDDSGHSGGEPEL